MAVSRIDIERALDALISDEEGMRFQGLAVVLAKQRWPSLIACERHNDLGLDAYASGSLEPDGIGKGLACSHTATPAKIKGDARKVKQNYPDVKILVFATPVKVTKETETGWADQIRNEFGYQLVLITREDIITSLMLPANACLCRTQLSIPVAIAALESQDLESVRAANSEAIAAWLTHPRLAGKPLITLQTVRLDQEGRETEEVSSTSAMQISLKEGRRLVLEGPAGRGKTTTLVQLAQQRVGEGGLAFLIDFPEWVRSRQDILEFIALMPQYRSRGIQAETLAKLYSVEHFSFLLNGWNEISETYSEDAVRALAQLERNFPAAGIIVATRTHHITPPLPGSFRAKLLPLNRVQRTEFLRQALGSRAEELRLQIDNNRELNELTRTPMILSEVVTLFQSGAMIPHTRVGVLGAVMQLMEQADEHRDHLQRAPLMGHASDYLAELAVQMTRQGDVRISEEQARTICYRVAQQLNIAGQIAAVPEPTQVLSTLCAHHILERLDYPSVAFRFEHQQFQEYYSASVLRKELEGIGTEDNEEKARAFAEEYVNRPIWEEPLRMLAEEVGTLCVDPSIESEAVRAGRKLVEVALPIDPIFAAELARLSGLVSLDGIRNALGKVLRSWYETGDRYHRQCALAGMLASGADEFNDIILPLLTSDDQQVRLRTYRTCREFHLSTLGPDWRHVVQGWTEDQRSDFVGETLRNRWSAELSESFALKDPSLRIRSIVFRELSWVGAEDTLTQHLSALNDDEFEQTVRILDGDDIPDVLWPRAISVYRKNLQQATDAMARVNLLIQTAAWGDALAANDIKHEVTGLPSERMDDHAEGLLKSALEIVRAADPEWVNDWVTLRMLNGNLHSDRCTDLVSSVPDRLRAELLDRLCDASQSDHEERGLTSLVARASDSALAADMISRMCEFQRAISEEPDQRHEAKWAVMRRLERVIGSLPPSVAVEGLLNCSAGTFDAIQFVVALDVLGEIGPEESVLRVDLPDSLRHSLRTYLKAGLPFVLSEEGC